MAPQYVMVAGMSVTISHSTPNGKDQFKLIYTLPGALDRETKNCGTMEEARAYAQSLEPKVRAELACTGTLVGEEWRRYEHAKPNLKWLKMPVDDLAGEYVAMKKLLGKRPVLSAVQAHVAMMPEGYEDMKLVDLLDKFLTQACTPGCKSDYPHNMRSMVRYVQSKLGDAVMVSQVTTSMLHDWVHQLPGEESRRHRRNAAVRLFNYGKEKNCVSRDPKSVAQLVPSMKRLSLRKKKLVEVFEPDIVARLISLLWERRDQKPRNANMLWYVVFCAFAGIRWKEMTRMTWEAVDLEHRRLLLGTEVTKTGEERPIPIQENLWQFLRILGHPREGRIVFSSVRVMLKTFAKEHGICLIRNGLRHSYGSYRLAVTQNVDALSEEMGNSPAMIKRCYRRVVAPTKRDAYWAIFPPGYIIHRPRRRRRRN